MNEEVKFFSQQNDLLLSVAVCSYNRSHSLARTLDSLVLMHTSGGVTWELIVVDNNSTDDTRATVERYADSLPIRYVFEAHQGLSMARNRAIREFRGDVLIFTDDDVVVEPNWLANYHSAVCQHPSAAYFGGKVLPFYPAGRPEWLTDDGERLALIDGLLVRFHLGDTVHPFEPGEPTPFGASFALRRSLIAQVGEFRRDLGVTGSVPGRGEEAEYLARAIAVGATGVYVGTAVVNHATDPRRLTLSYLYKYGQQKGIAARRTGNKEVGTPARALWFLVRGMRQLLAGRGDRFRQCVINCGIQIALWREHP